MNREWVRRELEDFVAIAKQYERETAFDVDPFQVPSRTAMWHAEPTVRQILLRLDPELATRFDLGQMYGHLGAITLVNQAFGIIDKQEEWAANLGSSAPSIAADKFHPWVWNAAQSLWETKHFRMAVNSATTAINYQTQAKIDRPDLHDDDLMNQAFTDQPKPGKKYLRLPGDPNDKTLKSRNNALGPFARGCIAGIRNPAAHEHGDDWDEHEALERLAALSILARWIDECEVLVGH